MRARVVLIPEEKLGFVILMNSSNTNLHASVAYRIIDHYLGAPPRDWSSDLLKIAKEQEAKNRAEEQKQIAERAGDTKPSLELEAYAGTYENEMYGQAMVKLEEGKLTLHFYPLFAGPMTHWHYDTFQVIWDDRSLDKDLISFTLGADGKVSELRWQGFTEFKRVK